MYETRLLIEMLAEVLLWAILGTLGVSALMLYGLRHQGATLAVRQWSEVPSWITFILGSVFGPAAVERFAQLRSAGEPRAAYAFVRRLWDQLPDSPKLVRQAIGDQYERLFAALPTPTYATPGNVDLPELWPHFAHAGVQILDGQSTDIGGLRWGFVGGGLLPRGVVPQPEPVFRSYLRTPEQYATAVAALGRVDMLCTHIPPAVPELLYDVRARRPEIGSEHLLALIQRDRPRYALFGHVHQPLARRVRVGRTECVNVGHFQRTGVPYVMNIC